MADTSNLAQASHQRPLAPKKRLIVALFLVGLISTVAWVLSGSQGKSDARSTTADVSKPSSLGSADSGTVTLNAIPATIVSKEELVSKTTGIGFPLYWNGEMVDTNIELTVLAEGKVFVRYLPKDVAAGAAEPYFTVASYYDPAGYARVLNLGSTEGAKFIRYSGGAVAASASESDSNIYFAFDGNPVVYNVYSPDPQVAWNGLDAGTLAILR